MNYSNFNPETQIWHNSQEEIPDECVGSLLLRRLEKFSDKVLQICDDTGTNLTGAEIRLRSIRIAENLLKSGYVKNDLITIVSMRSNNIVALVFGCILIGCPINYVDPTMTSQFEQLFNTIPPKVIFCNSDSLRRLQNLNLSTQIVTIDEKVSDVEFIDRYLAPTSSDDSFQAPYLGVANDTTLAVLCSSGTTTSPKGIIVTHGQIMSHLNDITMTILQTSEIYCSFNTLFWLNGLLTFFNGTLSGSVRIITKKPFSPTLMFTLMEKYKATILITPPSQIVLMLTDSGFKAAHFARIKFVICGGYLVHERIKTAMQKILPNGKFIIVYGLTEFAGAISNTFLHDKLNSVGTLTSGTMMKVIDEDGNSLGVGQEGELCVKRDSKFLGYYGNIQATNAVLDSDNWIHTGDKGRLDEDGFLFVIGRIVEIINYNNYQINPSEIEEVVIKLPGVAMVCVVALPRNDGVDYPTAVVIKHNDIDLTSDDIIRFVELQLPDYKRLRGGVYFTDCFPLTSNGKIIRRKIQEYAIEQYNKMLEKDDKKNIIKDNSCCC